MKNGEKSEISDEKSEIYWIYINCGGFWLKMIEDRVRQEEVF